MAFIEPDFSEVQEKIEAGTYHSRVVGSEMKESKKGNKYLRWTLETMNEANPTNNGRKIFHTTPISGKGAGILMAFYQACTGEELTKDNASFDTEQLIGRECEVVVDINENGYTEVKSVKTLG